MKCKICKTNDTDSTTGICWECCNRQIITDLNIRYIDFLNLKKDIGEELFNQLSYDDKVFIIEFASIINFKHPINFKELAKYIKNRE